MKLCSPATGQFIAPHSVTTRGRFHSDSISWVTCRKGSTTGEWVTSSGIARSGVNAVVMLSTRPSKAAVIG